MKKKNEFLLEFLLLSTNNLSKEMPLFLWPGVSLKFRRRVIDSVRLRGSFQFALHCSTLPRLWRELCHLHSGPYWTLMNSPFFYHHGSLLFRYDSECNVIKTYEVRSPRICDGFVSTWHFNVVRIWLFRVQTVSAIWRGVLKHVVRSPFFSLYFVIFWIYFWRVCNHSR